MRRFGLACLAVTAFAIGRTDAAPVPKALKRGQSDAERLVGTWAMVVIAVEGIEQPLDPAVEVRFAGGGTAVQFRGGEEVSTTYSLGADRTTGHLDWTYPNPAGGTRSYRCVYEFRGDRLIVARPLAEDGDRPPSTARQRGTVSYEFERAK